MQGGCVAKGVRADGLSGERRHSGGRRRYVAFEDRPGAEAGDAFAVGVQEQWRVWLGAVCPLTEIAAECVRGLLPQRADPLFASDLPRAFRTADLRLIHAAICCSRYSSWTCCGLRY